MILTNSKTIRSVISLLSGPPTGGGNWGILPRGPSLKGAPGGPMKGPLNTCLKDRYTLIEQSEYSSEEQCSKFIDKEIWLVMGSYCHCQQVVIASRLSLPAGCDLFFFFWSSPYNLGQGPHFNSLPWAP